MSRRTHFWLRIGALTLIVLAQLYPRIASQLSGSQTAGALSRAQVVTVANR